MRKSIRMTALMLGVLSSAALSTCSLPHSQLDQVRKLGVLRVATVNSPTSYYVGANGPVGFEYDLSKGLAEKLGVTLEIAVAGNASTALEWVQSGKVDIAAANLAITPQRQREVRFSMPLLNVVPQLVYRMGDGKPRAPGDLEGEIVLTANSVQLDRLAELKKQYPNLRWREDAEAGSEDLLYQVAQGNIAYTIANSDLVAMNQRYYPQLRVGFALAESQDLAWAFRKTYDTSVYDVAMQYLREIGDNELARLQDRYFGHVDQIDYSGAVAMATHVQTRLPRYRTAFEKAAKSYGLDWRLLAAIGYQESQWDALATSPTGVRGLMQLTADTALFLRVSDREDPMQSIAGGARYLRQMLDQLPSEIQEPDRTWMALAAYNMGIGHLLDAQKLAFKSGNDSTRWLDICKTLPLLTQARYYNQTRHGYARGLQAMSYVGNIRTYYDMLVWVTGGDERLQNRDTPQTVQATLPAIDASTRPVNAGEVLNIRTPLL